MNFTDFDNTISDTFSESPHKINVERAYSLSVLALFGSEASTRFIQNGGLANRTPWQVVQGLWNTESRSANNPSRMLFSARKYFEKNSETLNGLVPSGKGVSIDFTRNQIGSMTELLVRLKLSYLLAEVGGKLQNGKRWPEFFPGFERFAEQMDYGIISSGHEIFVQKAFEVHGIECPSVIVTDDDMRGKTHLSVEQKSKPSVEIINLALSVAKVEKAELYIGDDPSKDGKLAENAGIPYYWFMPELIPSKVYGYLPPHTFVFSSWNTLMDKHFNA